MLIHRTTSVHVVSVPSLKIEKLWRSECWNSMFFQAGSGILLAVPPKSSVFSKIINDMHISSEIFEICALLHLAMRISDPCPSRVLASSPYGNLCPTLIQTQQEMEGKEIIKGDSVVIFLSVR